jgi:hypothetical protein
MLNQLLLSSRCLELMRPNLQGHLLIVRVLLLLRLLLWVVNEILRSLMLSLLCILIDHVVDNSLNTASWSDYVGEELSPTLGGFMPLEQFLLYNVWDNGSRLLLLRLVKRPWIVLLSLLSSRVCRNHVASGKAGPIECLGARQLIDLVLHHLKWITCHLLLMLLRLLRRQICGFLLLP